MRAAVLLSRRLVMTLSELHAVIALVDSYRRKLARGSRHLDLWLAYTACPLPGSAEDREMRRKAAEAIRAYEAAQGGK
jgi:hypothetical protein